MEQNPIYRYEPLHESDAIRLINLQPSSDLSSRVQCSLTHTTLHDCAVDTIDHYTALSYVWGDASNTVTISVDGKGFTVTKNLDLALRHIRDERRARFVWADAICINQQDDEEKGRQVMQMGDVYRIAQHTIIFLGESTPESDALITLACPKRKTVQEPIVLIQEPIQELALKKRLKKKDKKRPRGPPERPDEPAATPDQLQDVLGRPWFTRVWIFQELLFSRSPWVQCGRSRARWDALAKICSRYQVGAVSNPLVDNYHRVFTEMNESRTELASSDYEKQLMAGDYFKILMTMMLKRRALGVQDPRDMVFAHLGIAGNGEERIVVDYTKTTKQVFENLAQCIMKCTDEYELLSYAESTADPAERCSSKLASWCPDWTSTGLPAPQVRLWDAMRCIEEPQKTDRQPSFYFTGLNCTQNPTIPPHDPTLTTLPSTLSCRGHHLGIIKSLSAEVNPSQASFRAAQPPYSSKIGHHKMMLSKAQEVVTYWQQLLDPLKIPLGKKGRIARAQTPVSFGILDFDEEQLRTSQHLIDHLVLHGIGTGTTSTSAIKYQPFVSGRRFAELEDGAFALVPGRARVGDVACLFAASPVPHVLRPCCWDLDPNNELDSANGGESHERGSSAAAGAAAPESGQGYFWFVGEAFVEGCMFAEGGLGAYGKKVAFAIH